MAEDSEKKSHLITIKNEYLQKIVKNRDNWADSHLNYIGTGPTTIEALGDDYDKIKAKVNQRE